MIEDLLELPLVWTVAVLVALSVVAILMIPWFRFVSSRRSRLFLGISAAVLAIMAVSLADVSFTRWCLYDGGHGRSPESAPLDQWLVFAAINALIATVAGIVGGLLGLAVAWFIERWRGGGRTKPSDKSTAN